MSISNRLFWFELLLKCPWLTVSFRLTKTIQTKRELLVQQNANCCNHLSTIYEDSSLSKDLRVQHLQHSYHFICASCWEVLLGFVCSPLLYQLLISIQLFQPVHHDAELLLLIFLLNYGSFLSTQQLIHRSYSGSLFFHLFLWVASIKRL